MFTGPVILTAVISGVGFLLNALMMYLVLSRGRKLFHILFAAILFICAVWDLGIMLTMLRNSHEQELIIYGYIVILPCTFLAPLIYQFTNSYLQRPKRKIIILLWVISCLGFIAFSTGWGGVIEGVYHYSWGNMYRFDRTGQLSALLAIPLGFFATISSARMLFQSAKREKAYIKQRHMRYMAVSFIALTLANIKLMVLYNIDNAFLLPAGMLMNDLFAALIAIAIVKHHLLDITVIIKRSAVYSALAAILIFVYSFSEHVLITTMGEMVGGHSQVIHLISIGIGIAVLMPVKHRLENRVETFFSQRSVDF